MADSFEPPMGPPPPKLPEGWKAVWNDKYEEWFYVNIYTKKSQWDKPNEPVYPSSSSEAPDGPPPYHKGNETKTDTVEKPGLSSNNPYVKDKATGGAQNDLSEDERLARQLQAEEDARAHPQQHRGEAESFYNQPGAASPGMNQYPSGPYTGQGYPGSQPSYMQSQYAQPLDTRSSKKGGLLGKLLGKASGSHGQQQSSSYSQAPFYGAPSHGQYGYGQQPGYQNYGQQPHKSSGMGGKAGLAALGVGGGLVGGALLADAIHDHDEHEYEEGYNQGYDNGGGDFGGDGGDFGGDGGGDFGGGF